MPDFLVEELGSQVKYGASCHGPWSIVCAGWVYLHASRDTKPNQSTQILGGGGGMGGGQEILNEDVERITRWWIQVRCLGCLRCVGVWF
jgi:hypothetical protein